MVSPEQALPIVDIGRLTLSPGDILVLRVKSRLHSQQHADIVDGMRHIIREAGLIFTVPFVVIDDDAEFQIVSGAATGGGAVESPEPSL